jgi:hypothetical protein
MRRIMNRTTRSAIIMFAVIGLVLSFDQPRLMAQRSKTGLSPADQQRYDELMESGRRWELIGYIGVGAGIFFLVASIPLSLYLARRKRLRKAAERAASQSGETPPAPRNDGGE